MSVGIYQAASETTSVSTGDNSYPVVFKVSNAGGTEERQLYLRHPVLSGEGAEFSSDVTIQGVDVATVDDNVSSWIQIAPDNAGAPGVYGAAGAAVNVGNVNLGDVRPFWVKITVPSTTEVGARDDVKLNLYTASSNANTRDIELSLGSFHEDCFYDHVNDRIGFVYQNSGGYGYFLTHWMDFNGSSSIESLAYTAEGGSAVFNYRAADDANGTNPSAWVEDLSNLDISVKKYVQMRVEMYGANIISGNGLTRYVHAGTSFADLRYTDYGYNPYSANPAGPYYTTNYSIEVKGYINLPVSGNYVFKTQSDDLGQWYVNGQLLTNLSVTTQSSAPTYFDAGWYPTTFRHNQGTGGYYFYNWITIPGYAERAVTATDFYDDRGVPTSDRYTYISGLALTHQGPYENNFDVRFYMGPATPELIAPEEGFTTNGRDFNPALTAVSTRCDTIQFQFDNVLTFDGAELQTWEVAASDDVEVTSKSPDEDRGSGVWYWRARAKLSGVYGTWSDYRTINISPYATASIFYYLNTNIGLEFLMNDEFYYLNVNVGERTANPFNRNHIYLNVNVGTGAGEVIYPLYDKTAVRKTVFDGDGDMFT